MTKEAEELLAAEERRLMQHYCGSIVFIAGLAKSDAAQGDWGELERRAKLLMNRAMRLFFLAKKRRCER